MLPSVIEVSQAGRYILRLRFDDGVEGEVDIGKTVTFDGVFEPLRDPGYFSQVRVDPELGTIVWPNGADLDPLVLHSLVTGVPILLESAARKADQG